MVLNTTSKLVFQIVSQTPEMGDSLENLGTWDCYTRLLPCLHCTPPIRVNLYTIISLNRPPGHEDDYVGALPCLHCGGEKGKPCTYLPANEFRTGRSRGNLARTPDMAVVTPLNNFLGPEGDTVTVP